jgi:hypothetical protein
LFHLNFTSKQSQFNLGYGTQIWKKKISLVKRIVKFHNHNGN